MNVFRFPVAMLTALLVFALLACTPAMAATDDPIELFSLFSMWGSLQWYEQTVIVLLMLHPVAGLIVAKTETPLDDSIYSWLYNNVLRPFALNISRATQSGPAK